MCSGCSVTKFFLRTENQFQEMVINETGFLKLISCPFGCEVSCFSMMASSSPPDTFYLIWLYFLNLITIPI
jgi:hypothetical protein